MHTHTDHARLLRRALLANAMFSTTSGIAVLAAARPLAVVMGLDMPLILVGIGISLIVFAVALYHNARRERINRAEAIVAVVLDVTWVIGSAVVIFMGLLSTTGNGLVAVVANIVLLLAVLQAMGLRQIGQAVRDGHAVRPKGLTAGTQ